MEASAALGGQGAQGAAAGGGEQGAEQQQAGFDPGQLVQSLSAIAEGQNETRELLRSLQEQRAGDGGQEGGEEEHNPFAGLDLSFLEETPEAEAAPDPQAFTAQLGAVLQQAVQQGVQQQMGQLVQPLQQEVQDLRANEAIRALAQEFPAFEDPDTAQEIVGLAGQLAQANGQPDLGKQPWFWRLTYMAAEAAAAANDAGDGAGDPNAAHLEGAGGALPGGSGGGDMGDAIVGSTKGRRVLPFG